MLTQTVDDIVVPMSLPPVDMIKLDVQGAEIDVLKGADTALKSARVLLAELSLVSYNEPSPLPFPVLMNIRLTTWLLLSLLTFTARAGSQRPTDIPAADRLGLQKAYDAARHEVRAETHGTLSAHNPGQQWRTRFDGRGFTVTPAAGGWTWGLELRRYGFAGAERAVAKTAVVSHEGGRVAYDWDETLREWFINDPRGLEQGWTFHDRPAGASTGGPLRIELALRGELVAEMAADCSNMSYRHDSGTAALTFSGLKAWDADGRVLAVRFEPVEGRTDLIRVAVEEADARYPVTVDPIARQAVLFPVGGRIGDGFGEAVAISGDTVVIGSEREDSSTTGINAPKTNSGADSSGAAYIFVRSGSTWTQQAFLKASNTDADDRFGNSVAISGNTVIVGAYREDSSATQVNGNQSDNSLPDSGAAYVFVRNGTTWTQQAYLNSGSPVQRGNFGRSVAISGERVVVGASREEAAYVFVRNGAIWSLEAPIRSGSTVSDENFGYSVGISDDTLVIGAPGEGSTAKRSGAAYVFTRDGTMWTEQQQLKASDASLGQAMAFSVAISGDTIIAGSVREGAIATDSGAAYVFVRIGTTWHEQAKLKASNPDENDQFGFAVGLSGDLAVVIAPNEDSSATGINGNESDNSDSSGAAYVFVRNGATWSKEAYLKGSAKGSGGERGVFWAAAVSRSTVIVGEHAGYIPGTLISPGVAEAFVMGGENSWLPENGASESFFVDANWGLGVVPQVTQSYSLPDAISNLVFDRPYANVNLNSKAGGGHTFQLAGNFYSLKNTAVDGGSVVLVDGGGTFETERLELGTDGTGEFKVLQGKLEILDTAAIGGSAGVTGRLVASGPQAEVEFKGTGPVVALGTDPGAGEILAEKGARLSWGNAHLQSSTQGEAKVTIQGSGTRSEGGRFSIAGKKSVLTVETGASFQTGTGGDDGLIVSDDAFAFFAGGSTGSIGKLHFIRNSFGQLSSNAAFTAAETKLGPSGGILFVNTGASLTTQTLVLEGGGDIALQPGGTVTVNQSFMANAIQGPKPQLSVIGEGARFRAGQPPGALTPVAGLKIRVDQGGLVTFPNSPWELRESRVDLLGAASRLTFKDLLISGLTILNISDAAIFSCGPLVNMDSAMSIYRGASVTTEDLKLQDGFIFLGSNGMLSVSDLALTNGLMGLETSSTVSVISSNGAGAICSLVNSEVDVHEGSLLTGGIIGVDETSKIRGSGTCRFLNVHNRGIIEPGSSPGTLTIEGNFQQTAGKVVLEIAGTQPHQQDHLVITGNAEFLGGSIELVFLDPFAPTTGQQFKLIQPAGEFILPASIPVTVRGLEPGWQFSTAFDAASKTWTVSSLSDGTALPPVSVPANPFRISNFNVQTQPDGSRLASGILTDGPADRVVVIQSTTELSDSGDWPSLGLLRLNDVGSGTFNSIELPPGPTAFLRGRVLKP